MLSHNNNTTVSLTTVWFGSNKSLCCLKLPLHHLGPRTAPHTKGTTRAWARLPPCLSCNLTAATLLLRPLPPPPPHSLTLFCSGSAAPPLGGAGSFLRLVPFYLGIGTKIMCCLLGFHIFLESLPSPFPLGRLLTLPSIYYALHPGSHGRCSFLIPILSWRDGGNGRSHVVDGLHFNLCLKIPF